MQKGVRRCAEAMLRPVKAVMRRTRWFETHSRSVWEQSDPFHNTPAAKAFNGDGRHTVGVIRDIAHNHRYYLAACRELGVGYRVVDLFADDWMEQVKRSEQRLFFAWPTVQTLIWKTMFDERIHFLVDAMGMRTVPTPWEMWLYESKRRVRDWLTVHGIAHPETHVFADRDAAMDFAASASLPVVFKADRGGGSAGVVICRSRRACRKCVQAGFNRGYLPVRWHPRDRQWGVVLFQAYVPDAEEWRVVRIGDNYLCRFKEKSGDFHSGSGAVRWAKPPEGLLDCARDITEKGPFESMNIDFFRRRDGAFLVNELHALFGDILPANRENGAPWMGRWQYDTRTGQWGFTPGYFYNNACANLRIMHALNIR